MQAVADHKGLFLDPYIGWPGKVYDARVFVNSSLYCKGVNGTHMKMLLADLRGDGDASLSVWTIS